MAQFQAAESNREDTLALVKSINLALGEGLSDALLVRTFDRFWPDLESQLKLIESRNAPRSFADPPRNLYSFAVELMGIEPTASRVRF